MWTMEQHRFRDLGIRSQRAGSGQPVLFLHGAAGLPLWTPFFEALSKQYDVRVPEHPGFGGSDAPAWIRSVSDMSMYYLDVLDQLIEARPQPGLYLERAQAKLKAGDEAGAKADCQEGLKLESDNRDLKWLLAEIKKDAKQRFKGKNQQPPGRSK